MNKDYEYKMTQRQILIENADRLHTTDMGMERIARNLGLSDTDPVQVCRNIVLDNDSIIWRQGKNWYCENSGVVITINSYSYTIITAHKKDMMIKKLKKERNSMDRYSDIKSHLIQHAEQDTDIKAVISIGSSTREEIKADEYSDLDLIIVSDNVEVWYSGEYPNRLGDVSISFIEPTLGSGRERRCIFNEDRDVDMIIFTPDQFECALKEGVAEWVMNRGYKILYDNHSYEEMIVKYVHPGHSDPQMTEEEFINLVNDFFFHNVWAAKKLLRGELWSAKMCVDAYLKGHLLKIVEVYGHSVQKKDVWHDGRFLDTWADNRIKDELKSCFAHYDRKDILEALKATNRLFERVAREIAVNNSYSFPDEAAACAQKYLENI